MNHVSYTKGGEQLAGRLICISKIAIYREALLVGILFRVLTLHRFDLPAIEPPSPTPPVGIDNSLK